ncbi:MAG TPA: YigZ family protein [Crocinitomicaceae bacterium]|nr:YigZ family protein [Crocinitomicaceae bacterium]
MQTISIYNSLKCQTEGVYKEKGSRFIGYAVACYSEQEAKAFLEQWSNDNHQARHLCYAYRFGVDKLKYRANDDGEPSNSAGAPILGQIDSYNLTNVLIGVVRYYGGTKLGVGGLINAYRTAAKNAIENGEVIELEVYQWYKMSFDYLDMPHVMNLLKKNDIEISEKKFEENCELKIKVALLQKELIVTDFKKYYSVKLNDLGIY